jgi:hypothetical protein
VTPADAGRKVLFAPGHVRVSGAGARGIVPTPPPARSPGSQGHGAGGQGKGQPGSHGKGKGNGLAAIGVAVAATSMSSGKVVPSPPDVPGAMILICSQVLTATQASFDTATIIGGNIPATYNHLRLVLYLRDTTNNTFNLAFMQVNNDTGANYYYENLVAHAAIASADEVLATTVSGSIGECASANSLSGVFGTITVDILLYAGATNKKTWLADWSMPYSVSTGQIRRGGTGGLWNGAVAAITSLKVLPQSGSWDIGSAFYLYGIT